MQLLKAHQPVPVARKAIPHFGISDLCKAFVHPAQAKQGVVVVNNVGAVMQPGDIAFHQIRTQFACIKQTLQAVFLFYRGRSTVRDNFHIIPPFVVRRSHQNRSV